jgi:hypothetical protein
MNMLRPILGIQHRLNPLHVYCRLLDTGLSREFSGQVCQCYEIFLFRWIARFTHRSTSFLFLTRERISLKRIT